MSKTNQPLVWEYHRKVDKATGLGTVVHYYDQQAQSLYLNNSLDTSVYSVPEGHWKDSELTLETTNIDSDILLSSFDHPSNGTLYGVLSKNNSLEFVRYMYSFDISNAIESWSVDSQNDNPISQLDVSVYNTDFSLYDSMASLFQPGAKVNLKIMVGLSEPYPMHIGWLDEINYDKSQSTLSLSGRNSIGFLLNDQTFDDYHKFEGTISDIIKNIFDYAGVTNYEIQELTESNTFDFKPSDSLLSGVNKIIDFYTKTTDNLEIYESEIGKIYFGYDSWMSNYIKKSNYTFDAGREVFIRSTTKAIDGSYTSIRAVGRDSNNKDLEPVVVPISNFKYWALSKHKTMHLTAPDGLTQDGLKEWAESQSKILQYVGIGEDFSGPFRPNLLIGDIAVIKSNGNTKNIGIITHVKNTFSINDGYKTEFSVDSGGISIESMSRSVTPPVYSRTANINGFNRKQNIVDLIRYTAKQANAVQYLNANDVKADPIGTADKSIDNHNASDLAHKDIRESIGSLSDLTTTDKTSLVKAINEIKSGGSAGGASTLSDLSDVYISALENGQFLIFDGSDSKWKNKAIPNGDKEVY